MHFAIGHAESAALAEDLLNRTVLPRLFRTLLNVDHVIKDMPEDTALAQDVDLTTIRRVVAGALPVRKEPVSCLRALGFTSGSRVETEGGPV